MGKRILITGKDSYIGEMFKSYIVEYGYSVDTLDVRSDSYTTFDFSPYDTVVHVAAIVHQKSKSFSREDYFNVNARLSYDICKKAKNSGVKQFVFLSSMSVYGVVCGEITKDTKLLPLNPYGESKLEGEKLVLKLSDDDFKVSVLRPPMVYGKGCKGNYVTLSGFAKKSPFFPDYDSKRSMIHIANLCSFMKKVVDDRLSGVFCPQDENYVRVSEMVKEINEVSGKKIRLTKVFNPLISLTLKLRISKVYKVFGTLTYDKDLCVPFDKISFKEAIEQTEK